MIHTSYFAHLKQLPKDLGVPVSIARGAPKGFTGHTHISLAPSKELLYKYKEGIITSEIYTEDYNRYLNLLNLKFVASLLQGEILCCWERPEKFCHRHLVREWLNKNGVECKEV